MSERKGFDLGDYVEVKGRIKLFYELFGQGRLVTGEVRATTEPDGKPRVWVQGLAYRTPDDKLPGIGWSWMELPGTTSYTKGSELENTETSAWGRAIGALGILIDRSIATQNEVDAKAGEDQRPASLPEPRHDGLVGTVAAGKTPVDLELRATPEGMACGFSLVDGRHKVQVLAHGPLAEALHPHLAGLVDQRVTVHGSVAYIGWKKDGKDMPPFQRLTLERIEAPGLTLPRPEAPSEPLFPDEFDPALSAEIDRQAAAVS